MKNKYKLNFNFILPLSNKGLRRIIYVFIVVAWLFIIVSGIAIGHNTDKKDPVDSTEQSTEPNTSDAAPVAASVLGTTKTFQIQNSEMNYGDLILVNYQYMCAYDSTELVPMLENSQYNYTVSDYEVTLKDGVFQKADELLGTFENSYSSDLLVACGYRSKEVQESLYNDKVERDGVEEADKWVAKPGYSEHQTGYAFDLSLMSDGITYEYTGEGDYAWINQNCYKYGFIVRYPVDKASITHIEYEPWHFRYVGVPHAEYIYNNSICFEEYIDLLHTKTIDTPLVINTSEQTSYAVYYQSCDSLATSTQLIVPADKEYTVSGDNVSGFIITVKI